MVNFSFVFSEVFFTAHETFNANRDEFIFFVLTVDTAELRDDADFVRLKNDLINVFRSQMDIRFVFACFSVLVLIFA